MVRAAQVAAACHALVALASCRLGWDGNITMLGKMGALLSQGALLLRTVIQLALGHHTALCNDLCGWCGCTALLANSVLVAGMAHTVQKSMEGLSTSRQTSEVVQKLVQHCVSGISYFTTTYFAMVDQSYASLVLPEWGVVLLAEAHYVAAVLLHVVSAPGSSLLNHAAVLQLCMIALPWFLRHMLRQQESRTRAARALQQQTQETCASSIACATGKAAEAGSGSCGDDDADTKKPAAAAQQVSGQVALRAAQSLVSAKGEKQHRPARYESVLGPAIQPLCLKIDTPLLEPEDLPVDAPQLLAAAFAHAAHSLRQELLLLGMSVRRGCILMAVQTFQPSSNSDADAAQKAVQMAQQLLPGLLQDLGLAQDAHALTRLMGPGTCMSLQQGTQLVQAKFQPASGQWGFAPQPSVFSMWRTPAGVVRPPQLGSGIVVKPMTLQRTSSDSYGSSSTVRSNPAGIQPPVLPPSVNLEVAVLCNEGQASSLLVMGAGGAQQNTKAGSVEVEDPSVLQLCALGDEGYLPACVLKQTPVANGQHLIIEVEVQLQPDGLVRHDLGGSFAALQPVCLQLWCGKLLLSSSHVLLSTSTEATAVLMEGTRGPLDTSSRFGWWGTTAAIATSAADELKAEVQRAAAAADLMGVRQEAVAVQELVRDVCYWLAGVRHMACLSDWCACTAAGGAQRSLPVATLLSLADSLSDFAASCGLANLHNMIQQQRRLVTRAQKQANRMASSIWARAQQQAHAAAVQVHAALFGHVCPQCERHIMQQMYASLGQASVCYSCISALGAGVIITRRPSQGMYALSWMVSLWGIAHLGMCVVRCATQAQGVANHKTGLTLFRALSLFSYVIKLLMLLSTALGLVQRFNTIERQHRLGRWVLVQLNPVLADYLQLLAALPQPAVTLLMLVEFVAFTASNKRVHGWVASITGTGFAVLVAPLMLQLYARSRVGVGSSKAAAARDNRQLTSDQQNHMHKLKSH